MSETFRSRNRPVTNQAFLVTTIRLPDFLILIISYVIRLNLRIFIHFRNSPSGRTVSDKGIGQQDNRSHMLHGQLTCPKRGIKTISRRRGRYYHGRALTITAIQSLHQVRLLALRRQARRRTATLNIDNHQRQLSDHRQTDRLALQGKTRSGSRCSRQATGETSSDRSTDTGDLILGLNRDNA